MPTRREVLQSGEEREIVISTAGGFNTELAPGTYRARFTYAIGDVDPFVIGEPETASSEEFMLSGVSTGRAPAPSTPIPATTVVFPVISTAPSAPRCYASLLSM